MRYKSEDLMGFLEGEDNDQVNNVDQAFAETPWRSGETGRSIQKQNDFKR
jgi:hypothetical protein